MEEQTPSLTDSDSAPASISPWPALALGVLSIALWPLYGIGAIPGIAAILYGVSYLRRTAERNWLPITGIFCGGLGVLMSVQAMVFSPQHSEGKMYESYMNESVPSFSMMDTHKKEHSLEDYRGKVVLINFWATWCRPCIREMPDLVSMRNRLAPRGFEILGVSEESAQQQNDFARRYGVNFPLLVAGAGMPEPFDRARYLLPTSFLIDRQGNLREVFVGYYSNKAIESRVAAILDEPWPSPAGEGAESGESNTGEVTEARTEKTE